MELQGIGLSVGGISYPVAQMCCPDGERRDVPVPILTFIILVQFPPMGLRDNQGETGQYLNPTNVNCLTRARCQ
jgi:hypothetical protein